MMQRKRPESGERWVHYKGGEYDVITIARDEGCPENEIVVYRDQEGGVWARPLKMWMGTVGPGKDKRNRFMRLT